MALIDIPSGLGQDQLFSSGVAHMSRALEGLAGIAGITLHVVSQYPAGLPRLVEMIGEQYPAGRGQAPTSKWSLSLCLCHTANVLLAKAGHLAGFGFKGWRNRQHLFMEETEATLQRGMQIGGMRSFCGYFCI